MKRGIFDLLRRGLDSSLANWQISLIRFVEMIVFMAIAIGAVIAILLPVLISVGIHLTDLDTPEDLEMMAAALVTKWVMLIWIVLGVSVLILVFVLIHSFVEAGSARVLVDADRVAGPAVIGDRNRYRIFSMDRWLAGAKDGWWTVFWIYNLIWGIAGLLMLIPLVPTTLLIFLFREEEAAAVLTGCLGLLVSVLFMILVAFVANMWSNRAIVAWAAHHTGTRESMGVAWTALKRDLGRHLAVALAIIVVAMAGSMFLSSFSYFGSFGQALGSEMVMLVAVPIQIFTSLINSAFSAFIGTWLVASYAALALDPK